MMMSGLSGNEIYCLAQKGWTPGNIVVGNSVYSLGFLGSITSGLRMMAGGEIENITRLISDGRHAAIQRLEQEANEEGAHGLTGVISELKSVSVEGDDTVVATHRDRAQRGEKTLDQDETLTFTISDGKFTRLVENHSDQAAYDAFWSS